MANTNVESQIVLGTKPVSNKGLWIAIGLGLVAAMVNMVLVSRVEGTKLTVLKARTRLLTGRRVTEADFTPIDIYGTDLRQMRSLLVDPKDLSSFRQIPLAETIEVGQILMQGSFGFTGNRGIRDLIGKDQRAIAMQVKDESSAVGYYVRPGDVVDVYASDGANMQKIIERATVRAIGDATVVASESGGKDFQYRTVTIVVPNDIVGEILNRLQKAKGGVVLALAGAQG